MTTKLDKELQTYRAHLASLLPQEGKYVLIHGEDVVDTFDSYADALKIGYEKFNLAPFLVRKISAEEKVAYFSRDFGVTCQT